MYWILIFISIGFLWFRLINNLRMEWNTDLQYSYGLLVPWLALGLIIRRWLSVRKENRQTPKTEAWT
jgi:hypothetical protein